MFEVYLSIGSNIDPNRNIVQALEELTGLVEIRAVSPVYRTKPVQLQPGADEFHNLCVKIATDYRPGELKSRLNEIERTTGREQRGSTGKPYESRKVDIDVLFYEPEVDGFEPHPQVEEEAFVVFPLSDLLDPSSREDLPDSRREWRKNCNRDVIKGTVSYDWPSTITRAIGEN